jgi:hypothetical protein
MVVLDAVWKANEILQRRSFSSIAVNGNTVAKIGWSVRIKDLAS